MIKVRLEKVISRKSSLTFIYRRVNNFLYKLFYPGHIFSYTNLSNKQIWCFRIRILVLRIISLIIILNIANYTIIEDFVFSPVRIRSRFSFLIFGFDKFKILSVGQ